jgi:RimJ/RimL family protein N-acetyltransferase
VQGADNNKCRRFDDMRLIKMKYIELESERLIYRKFDEKDFPILFSWVSNTENMKYREEPLDESQAHGYLNWLISNTNAEDILHCEYAVVRKSDNKLIGSAVLMHLPDNPEIGWTLHRDYWRQGYGTEMGETMLMLGFDVLNLRRITAVCSAENIGSYKIMERIGMRREANFIKSKKGNSLLNNEWCDEVQYAILQEEWVAAKDEK